jgi:hypothetical protein
MRLLFLIQTHTEPDQVARLARVLRKGCPGSVVLISHNTRSGVLPLSLFDGEPDIHVIRGSGGRGDFSILDGYLAAVRWLRENKIDYDWLTNLSGQDYPVSSLAEFSRELSQSSHDGFLDHFDILKEDPQDMSPMVWSHHDGYDRYYYQYTKVKDNLNIVERAALRLPRLAIERLTDKLRIFTAYGLMIGRQADRTPFTADFRCYAGSYWHTIRQRCVEYLLDFADTQPDVVEYFRKVLVPDESFVHTVLMNNPDFRFVNDSRRYIDMRGARLGRPKFLTENDMPAIAGQRYVFARKIEWTSGPELFDNLDTFALGSAREAVVADAVHR